VFLASGNSYSISLLMGLLHNLGNPFLEISAVFRLKLVVRRNIVYPTPESGVNVTLSEETRHFRMS
jgi:hypothetical protein